MDAGVLATACPYCVQNFEDAVKTRGLGGVRVMEAAEVFALAVGGP